MTDILTAEDIKTMKLKGNSDTYTLWNAALPTIEAQAAEIKGLREALERIYDPHFVNSPIAVAEEALSRTPAEWVEGERVEGDVLRAATEWQTYWHENPHDEEGINRRQGYLYDRVKRLKAWEGGK